MKRVPNTVEDFIKRIEFTDTCWLLNYRISKAGYPRWSYKGITYNAHAYSYLLFVGELLPNHVIDHLCCNKICVNPRHLERVTHRENIIRGLLSRGVITTDRYKQLSLSTAQ